MIFRLDERLVFPDPALAEDDGLLAIEGDLSPERLMLAYHSGIFPWYNDDTPILWFSPHQRFVLYPAGLHVSRGMRQLMKSNQFKTTYDRDFVGVIKACSQVERPGQDGTWLIPDMIAAYIRLHRLGYAHSIEVWQGSELVGGMYGVRVNKVFCGESMFSKVSNASKLALITLCNNGIYQMIDCQVYSTHLESMGARMIGRDKFMKALKEV